MFERIAEHIAHGCNTTGARLEHGWNMSRAHVGNTSGTRPAAQIWNKHIWRNTSGANLEHVWSTCGARSEH
eukprot:11190683-Lingulodinium_polyedra.AAC.1